MKAAAVGAVLTIGLISGLIVTACDDDPAHAFFAQAYEPGRDCLDTVTALDTIDGEDTGQDCPPLCIVSEPGAADAGVTVYVSTTCEPYPPFFDVSQTNPLCAPALLAAKNQSTCFPDGGRSSNVPDVDASTPSTDAGAIVDSGSD